MLKDFILIWKVFLVVVIVATILKFCIYSDKEYNSLGQEERCKKEELQYLDFMDVGIRLAARNKEIMAQEIMTFLGVDEKDGAIKTNHNYYDRRERTVRKGAVSAKKGELFLCPINMRDGTFICRGKGNDDWNQSAPHGAGRRMSRADAKELLDVGSVRATLGELFTTTVDSSLDEAPDAYKRFDFIREHITPTAEVADRLIPLYNFKG